MKPMILIACCGLLLVNGGSAAEDEGLPKGIPPVVGTAVVGAGGSDAEWTIRLTVPVATWEVVGEVDPKKTWPELKATVKKELRTLKMGGPSALSPSRVMDVKGNELTREEAARLLAKETPVLISLSGEMLDAYYLAVAQPETPIIVLGPRDGMPATDLLPVKKPAAAK